MYFGQLRINTFTTDVTTEHAPSQTNMQGAQLNKGTKILPYVWNGTSQSYTKDWKGWQQFLHKHKRTRGKDGQMLILSWCQKPTPSRVLSPTVAIIYSCWSWKQAEKSIQKWNYNQVLQWAQNWGEENASDSSKQWNDFQRTQNPPCLCLHWKKMLLKQPNRNKRKSKQTDKNALDNASESFLFSFGLGVGEKIHKGTSFFRMGMKDV